MAEDQKNSQKGFPNCCEGMPFADMMRKMMEAKKSGSAFNCAEIMSQMMRKCCGPREKKEETKENPVPKP